MALIRLENARPGQQLNADVKDRSGRILLRKGSELAGKNLKIFKSWGILEVDICCDDVTDNNEPSAVDLDQLDSIESKLAHRFRFSNRAHPFINNLFHACIKYQAKKKTD